MDALVPAPSPACGDGLGPEEPNSNETHVKNPLLPALIVSGLFSLASQAAPATPGNFDHAGGNVAGPCGGPGSGDAASSHDVPRVPEPSVAFRGLAGAAPLVVRRCL